MDKIYVIKTKNENKILSSLNLETPCFETIDLKNRISLKGKKILFVTEADSFGNSPELYDYLTGQNERLFENSVAGLIVASETDLYSKSLATKIVFDTNLMGLSFIGRPLVESTASKKNFRNIISEDFTHEAAFLQESGKLIERLAAHQIQKKQNEKILVLHASNKNSNTLMLWGMVKKYLTGINIKEISIENGKIYDCRGCTFKVCTHYGEQESCFYGGIITNEVFPAIIEADKLVFLCPNYNDAISANMSALINRLTALYRAQNFENKQIFSIIVSGYSGSDSLAKQLIGALNMNKSFLLPPKFAMMEIANNRGEILGVEGIEERAREFAIGIKNS